MGPPNSISRWGTPPWHIDFLPPPTPLPAKVNFAVIGAGFTGLAAASWLRRLAPDRSVAIFEAGKIGHGASGRTGGMALAESAAGDLPGLGDVLGGLKDILDALGVQCDLSLPGAWEIAREGGLAQSPISWTDSGRLRAVAQVPGGTIDPGKLASGLARAATGMGASIFENHKIIQVLWGERARLEVSQPGMAAAQVTADKVLFSTNGASLALSGLQSSAHPKLTLATQIAPLGEEALRAIGLSEGKPFYTIDFPYLWGRTLPDGSVVWGSGLVDAPPSGDLEEVEIGSKGPSGMFTSLEHRIRGLHPALASAEFTHRWGGPILFRDDWQPVFDWHPKSRNGIVLGAFAGHGVALSSYLGRWAAEVLLGRRQLPKDWGSIAG